MPIDAKTGQDRVNASESALHYRVAEGSLAEESRPSTVAVTVGVLCTVAPTRILPGRMTLAFSPRMLGWSLRPGVTQLFRNNAGSGDRSLASGTVNLLGAYFKERVRTSVGVSREHWLQSASRSTRAAPVTNERSFVNAAWPQPRRIHPLLPTVGTTPSAKHGRVRRARDLNAESATIETRQFLAEQNGGTGAETKFNASLVTRYTFREGRIKGFDAGVSSHSLVIGGTISP